MTVLLDQLQTLTHTCKALKEKLQNDGDHFAANNIVSLKSSDEEKVILLNTLNETITGLFKEHLSQYSGELSARIHALIENQPDDMQVQIKDSLQALRTEMIECYQYLAINSKVLSHQLEHMQLFWQKILGQAATPTYNQKGQMG